MKNRDRLIIAVGCCICVRFLFGVYSLITSYPRIDIWMILLSVGFLYLAGGVFCSFFSISWPSYALLILGSGILTVTSAKNLMDVGITLFNGIGLPNIVTKIFIENGLHLVAWMLVLIAGIIKKRGRLLSIVAGVLLMAYTILGLFLRVMSFAGVVRRITETAGVILLAIGYFSKPSKKANKT